MTEQALPEEAIFDEAVQIESAADRAAYLDRACGDHPKLKAEVEALLRVHDKQDSFLLDALPPGIVATVEMPQITEHLGTIIGPYKLLEQIGEGGFGIVYLAEQEKPVRRRVALKIIKPGMDTRQVIARFEAERQALALMNHPNIAHVLEAGATDSGRPYFVMELVKGIPITNYCDQCNLSTRDRLELFVLVCQAVQHAHQKGIIHRDIKPSNVLIAMQDGRPTPKVIDFGVAKAINQRLTEATAYTQFAQIVGTPLYMSPEQAGMNPLDVDTRSDIYSLGVLLYELLTGTTPFVKERLKDAGYDELRRILREEEPPKPSQRLSTVGPLATTIAEQRRTDPRRLSQLVRGDLDWIVMKALEKDRSRRYETTTDLAQDIQCYLDGEAVLACPPSAFYRFSKFARRNRVTFATSALVAAALLLGTLVSTGQAIRATRAEHQSESRFVAEREARVAEQEARVAAQGATTIAQQNAATAQQNAAAAYRQQYKAEMRLGLSDWEAGNVSRLYQAAIAHLPEPHRADLRGWEWYYLLSRCQQGRILCEHRGLVSSVAWSPDGRHLATTSWDGDAIVWDARSGARVRRFSISSVLKNGVAWSPDGQRLAWASVGDDNALRIWDRVTDEIHVLRGHTFSLRSCQWSPDGRRLASTSLDKTARIWDAETRTCLHVLQGHTNHVYTACWSRDGKFLVTVAPQEKGSVKVWDAVTGGLLRELSPEPGVTSASVSSHGPKQLILGTRSGNYWLLNIQTWQTGPKIQAQAHAGAVNAVAFSPDGATFASAGADGRVSIWDATQGRLLFTLHGHQGPVTSLAWNPNGKQLASGSADRSIRLWEVPPPQQPTSTVGFIVVG